MKNFKFFIPFLLYIKMTQVVSDSTRLFFKNERIKNSEMEKGNGREAFYFFFFFMKERENVEGIS